MPEITFLEREQLIWGNKLDMFYKIGIEARVTDFAVLLGASLSVLDEKEKYGYYFTKTKTQNGIYVVHSDGDLDYDSVRVPNNSVRPVLKNVSSLGIDGFDYNRDNQQHYFNYGEYPQKAVDKLDNGWLEKLYTSFSDELKLTGKTYTIDKGKPTIKPIVLNEYLYRNKKYVRVKANSCYFRESYMMSNGEYYKNDDYVWVEVLPIKWIYDKKNDIGVSEKLLLSGLIFDRHDYDGNFDNTVIKKSIDKYFSKEIVEVNKKKKEVIKNKEKVNPYNFDFSEVSEEEIIKGCVLSNIAVMLHGKSGDGKSARVKELDPDAEILYLINASPESLCGKSIFYNNEMIDIPPTWYIKLVDKCKKEPDKIHIVFFDEITNAPSSIQGLSFNIILDKEVNGKWKLPENARIVAAGNELEESMSSYGMSEPLFNRFAHVYIETKVDEWLNWASTPSESYERLDYKDENIPMKIHPSIYTYILYKGENVLRTEYNGKTPNADPRKWELASKILYKTNNPMMLRSLVGEEITRDFIDFCKEKVITLEDVINGNYTDEDLRMDTSKKYNTAVHLSSVNFEQVEIVREFVKKLGSETCALFDTLWSKGIDERLEKIREIKLSEKMGGNVL